MTKIRLGDVHRTEEHIDVQHAHALLKDLCWEQWRWADAEVEAGRDPYPMPLPEGWHELHDDVWLTALEARQRGCTIASLCRAVDWTPGIVKRELRVAAGLVTTARI